jgi:hypothetical protein
MNLFENVSGAFLDNRIEKAGRSDQLAQPFGKIGIAMANHFHARGS